MKKFLYDLKMQVILTIILFFIGYIVCKIGAFIQNMEHPVILFPIVTFIIYKFMKGEFEG